MNWWQNKRLSNKKQTLCNKWKKIATLETRKHLSLLNAKFRKPSGRHIGTMSAKPVDSSEQNNSKQFWRYIKAKRTENIGVAPLKKDRILHSRAEDRASRLPLLSFWKKQSAQFPILFYVLHRLFCICSSSHNRKENFRLWAEQSQILDHSCLQIKWSLELLKWGMNAGLLWTVVSCL